MTQAQLAWYRAMEEAGELRQIRDLPALEAHLLAWENDPATTPIGYILSLEGADSLITLQHLERSWEKGLRAIGPAHYGPGVYAFGTDSIGRFSSEGTRTASRDFTPRADPRCHASQRRLLLGGAGDFRRPDLGEPP